jgi:phospholipase/lecithinase/hemolysin
VKYARILLFCAGLASCDSVKAGPWAALYAFGDSYSDSGAGYVDCNGPTAVVYLARGLGIPFTYATDPNRAGKGLNFAVSGAPTGLSDGFCVKGSLFGRGMLNQVDDFLSRVKSAEIKFESTSTLFFLAGGLNDGKLSPDETKANIEREVRALYAVGARHFLIALIPDLPPRDTGKLRRNLALREIPRDIRLPGAFVRLSRWGEYFDEVMEHASKYGFKNTTDACAGRALRDQDPTPRGDPKTYYYYHEGHPSTEVHRIVGQGLIREALDAANGVSANSAVSPASRCPDLEAGGLSGMNDGASVDDNQNVTPKELISHSG